jgi:NAD-specific glutamate dehydrogenase
MPNPTPEHAAILVHNGILENLEALSKTDPSPSEEDIKTRNAQLNRLTDRGIRLLTAEGFESDLEEVIAQTDNFYKNLLMRSMTSRLSEHMNPDKTDPRIHKIMNQIGSSAAKEPLAMPDIDSFVQRMREPYGALLGAVAVVYTSIAKREYETRRDAGNVLLGLNFPNRRTPQP